MGGDGRVIDGFAVGAGGRRGLVVALGSRPHSWQEVLIRAGDLQPRVFRCFSPTGGKCLPAVCSWSGLTDGAIATLQPVSHAGCNWEASKEQPFFSTN